MSTDQELDEYFYSLSEKFITSVPTSSSSDGTIILKESKFKKLQMSFYEWYSVDFEFFAIDEEYYSDKNDIARIPVNEEKLNSSNGFQGIYETLNPKFFKNLRIENKRKIIDIIEEIVIRNS